jgi:molybdenum cofactor biosynthesis enzyme MoaA
MKIKVKLNGCNLNCDYCPEANRGQGSNDVGKIKQFILGAYENGLDNLQWSGGEPTIHPEFVSLVEFAKGVGFYQSLSTNGTCTPEYLEKLKSSGIARVNISLDTLDPDKFKRITGRDMLDTVLNSIKVSSLLFDEVTKINTVVSDVNIDEVWDIYNYFKSDPKVITRFLQLTYKGNDKHTEEHRVAVSSVESILPVHCSREISLHDRTYTNPVAKYYKTGENVYSIIPQNHNCNSISCNKIWLVNDGIFICKMVSDCAEVDKNINETIKNLIDQKCILKTNPNGHRVANRG